MKVIKLDLAKTGLHHKMISDYVSGNSALSRFYKWTPSFDSFAELIKQRVLSIEERNILADELCSQNLSYFKNYPLVQTNVNSLRSSSTFTITTGHQLCLATGPLYFLYKIISTIKLTQELKLKFPDNNFVPVYWMATEDHDIAEINHTFLFNKKIDWKTEQKGATGRLLTNDIGSFLAELKSVLGDSIDAIEIVNLQTSIYSNHNTISSATRELVMQLFGEYGLVVIDADCRKLKSQFIPIVKNELMNSPTVGLVNATSANLNVAYNSQIVPRDINLFYLDGDVRERIVKSDEGEYLVLNTNLKFSKSEIVSLVEANPEKFSPNVALRPVYQERILPNLAYIGGPGEISYWLQLLSTFDHFEVAFPMLVVRNHALIIQDKSLQKFESLGFSLADLFCSVDELTKKYIQKHESSKIDFDSFAKDFDSLFKSLGESMAVVDATLLGATQAELQKSKNGIVLLEKKYQAALKRKNEVAINQIKGILEKAFPDNSPQERRSNYYGFPSDVRSTLINQALNSFRTFENELTIFVS